MALEAVGGGPGGPVFGYEKGVGEEGAAGAGVILSAGGRY